MRPGLQMDDIEKTIDTARRLLAAYWDELLECYDTGALPGPPCAPRWLLRGPLWVPKDMTSGNFLRKAKDYMYLVEPIDCASWYRLGIHQELDGDGQQKGHYTHANPFRPGRYSRIESHMASADRQAWHLRLSAIAAACNQAAAQPVAQVDVAGDENGVL